MHVIHSAAQGKGFFYWLNNGKRSYHMVTFIELCIDIQATFLDIIMLLVYNAALDFVKAPIL